MKDGKHVVLYVDDDQDFLDAVRVVLEANGYEMIEAGSAEEGLKTFRQSDPDFVIVDLMMEEVDAGTSLVKNLKAEGCQAPVYMLSSVGDAMNLNINPSELGLEGVLQKPVQPNTLLSILQAKLKSQQ